jgi:hypothetical protein
MATSGPLRRIAAQKTKPVGFRGAPSLCCLSRERPDQPHQNQRAAGIPGKATDKAEDVANVLETVVLKNT